MPEVAQPTAVADPIEPEDSRSTDTMPLEIPIRFTASKAASPAPSFPKPDAPSPLLFSPTRTKKYEVVTNILKRKGEHVLPSMSPGLLGSSSSSTMPAHQEFAEVGTDIKKTKAR